MDSPCMLWIPLDHQVATCELYYPSSLPPGALVIAYTEQRLRGEEGELLRKDNIMNTWVSFRMNKTSFA